MKRRTTIISALMVSFVLSGWLIASKTSGFQSQDAAGLAFKIEPDKESYLLGELISLKFKVMNKSDSPVSVDGSSSVYTGSIEVLVAYEKGPFRKYYGPRWGTLDVARSSPLELKPGNSFESEATLLQNPYLETSHLNENAAKHAREQANLVEDNYLLSKPGTYYIKAILHDAETKKVLESEPVQVVATEPADDDLEIWERIKSDRSYGYFIQTGGLNEHPAGAKTMKMAQSLNALVLRHPNSQYAAMINSGLSRHKAKLDKANDGSKAP